MPAHVAGIHVYTACQHGKTWMAGTSRIGANLRSSLPGLTRQSIDLRKNFLAKKMDARVKPAHDELAKQLKLAPMGTSPAMTTE
jgi:hypothetical protein